MKFNKIIYIVINEKYYILLFNNVNVIIFVYRNYKNKNKYLIKKNYNYDNYREVTIFAKSLIENLNIFQSNIKLNSFISNLKNL